MASLDSESELADVQTTFQVLQQQLVAETRRNQTLTKDLEAAQAKIEAELQVRKSIETWKQQFIAEWEDSKCRFEEDLHEQREQLKSEAAVRVALEGARQHLLEEVAVLRRELSARASPDEVQGSLEELMRERDACRHDLKDARESITKLNQQIATLQGKLSEAVAVRTQTQQMSSQLLNQIEASQRKHADAESAAALCRADMDTQRLLVEQLQQKVLDYQYHIAELELQLTQAQAVAASVTEAREQLHLLQEETRNLQAEKEQQQVTMTQQNKVLDEVRTSLDAHLELEGQLHHELETLRPLQSKVLELQKQLDRLSAAKDELEQTLTQELHDQRLTMETAMEEQRIFLEGKLQKRVDDTELCAQLNVENAQMREQKRKLFIEIDKLRQRVEVEAERTNDVTAIKARLETELDESRKRYHAEILKLRKKVDLLERSRDTVVIAEQQREIDKLKEKLELSEKLQRRSSIANAQQQVSQPQSASRAKSSTSFGSARSITPTATSASAAGFATRAKSQPRSRSPLAVAAVPSPPQQQQLRTASPIRPALKAAGTRAALADKTPSRARFDDTAVSTTGVAVATDESQSWQDNLRQYQSQQSQQSPGPTVSSTVVSTANSRRAGANVVSPAMVADWKQQLDADLAQIRGALNPPVAAKPTVLPDTSEQDEIMRDLDQWKRKLVSEVDASRRTLQQELVQRRK
eukprot:TRINITY_DN1842_c0_g1_i1.p1 TRINITY_DN1842_c0_g1~~TRINITY_DN1842_c0_g1_i1.p1  ORF type:complete len:698 (-),score=189.35 TRINITY_DN1842_c0_g1_i1:1864-3957(-)